VGEARRLHGHGRRAVLERARTLAHASRVPAQHVARHRGRLHQLARELRASARRTIDDGRALTSTYLLVLRRGCERGLTSDAPRRRRDLDRLTLALAAHDPRRTLARGYALVEDRDGQPLTSAAAARAARRLSLRFHDDSVPARVDDE
jgi:exodeoxyribonuclease VII large subunit